MKTATTIQENAEDIYAEAQQINEDRAAQAAQEFDGEAEAAKPAADAEHLIFNSGIDNRLHASASQVFS